MLAVTDQKLKIIKEDITQHHIDTQAMWWWVLVITFLWFLQFLIRRR